MEFVPTSGPLESTFDDVGSEIREVQASRLRAVFLQHIRQIPDERASVHIVVWGSGAVARDLLESWAGLPRPRVCDSNATRWGSSVGGFTVESPTLLSELDPEQTLVILAMSVPFQNEVASVLSHRGFNHARHRLDGRIISPVREPRLVVEVREDVGATDAFRIMSEAGIKYVLLHPPKLDRVPPSDYDILLDERDLARFFGLQIHCSASSDTASAEFDFYLTSRERLDAKSVMPPHLTNALFADARKDREGCMRLSGASQFAALAFRTLFSKAEEEYSDRQPSSSEVVGQLESESFLPEDLPKFHPSKLWNYLEARDFLPPLDVCRKLSQSLQLASQKPSWLEQKLSPSRLFRSKELIVFVIRSGANHKIVAHEILNFFDVPENHVLVNRPLTSEEIDRAVAMIRGGVWRESPASSDAGLPARLLCWIDHDPKPPRVEAGSEHPFLGNDIYARKQILRKHLSSEVFGDDSPGLYFHCPDDEREALDYAEVIMSGLSRKLIQAVAEAT